MCEGRFAFVTLSTDDNYCKGALVLGHSLKLAGTKAKLVVLVTDGVSDSYRSKLSTVFDIIQDVSIMDSKDEERLALMRRPELGVTFTKLNCWRLAQFTKCVFLDADVMVLKNCDELFEREELSAVVDIGWPDCFNSGVFVYQPSESTYQKLVRFAVENGSFDGGDQGLLNTFFSDWAKDVNHHLSFIYNMAVSNAYSYLPAYKQFGANVKIVHFLGAQKPWMFAYDKDSGAIELGESIVLAEHIELWWHTYKEHVETDDTAGLTEDLEKLEVSSPVESEPKSSPTTETSISDEAARQYAWEHGQIDYMGRDSFDNILQRLDDVINGD